MSTKSTSLATNLAILPDALVAAGDALRKEIADPNMNAAMVAADLRAMASALNLCADGLAPKAEKS